MESQPWSKSSPRGELEPVLLACLPSQASRDWYTNRPRAHKINAQQGGYRKRAKLSKMLYNERKKKTPQNHRNIAVSKEKN